MKSKQSQVSFRLYYVAANYFLFYENFILEGTEASAHSSYSMCPRFVSKSKIKAIINQHRVRYIHQKAIIVKA